MEKYVALLRGVNVGGNNRLPMRDLAEMFRDAGCEDVRTFIQSGNAVFSADAKLAATLPDVIAEKIQERFGFRSPVVLRSAKDMEKVVAGNPFPGEEDLVYAMFLANEPAAELASGLDADRCPPNRFALIGREIYLYMPGGIAKTKLTNAYFDSKLKTIGTTRNWRTVLSLLELVRG